MGTPKPAEKRCWPGGVPIIDGLVHEATCNRLLFTAASCPCGHVERVITRGKTAERAAQVRQHQPTYCALTRPSQVLRDVRTPP